MKKTETPDSPAARIRWGWLLLATLATALVRFLSPEKVGSLGLTVALYALLTALDREEQS